MTSRSLARIIVAQLCLHACMAGLRMAAPLLALRDGYSPLAVGFLLALFSLMQVFLALPAGRYADRHGLRRPMGLAVLASIAGSCLAAAFPTFAVLCVAALLTGGATGAASIALQRHVGRAAHGATELKQVFSWLSIGPAASNFLGPFVAGLLIDYAGRTAGDTLGYRIAFLVLAAMPLLTWMWIRQVVELEPVEPAQGRGPRGAWDLMREPMMMRLMAVNWCMSSCWDVHNFVVPVIGHERGLNASTIGAILGAFAIAAASVRIVMPIFAARLREHVVLGLAMLLTAAMFCIYPWMHTPLAMGACSVLLGVALGTVQPMVMSTLHQITPPARHGEALGIRLMAINASSVLVPMLFGTVGAIVGVSVVFWTAGGVVGACSRIAWRMRPAAPPGPSGSP